MIRINLIPAKRKKKAKPVPKFLIGLVLLLVFSIIGSVLAINYFNGIIKDLERQKKTNTAKIAELKEKIKEVDGYEARNELYKERKRVIEDLTKNVAIPAKVLDEMAARLTQGVWITSLAISRSTISISGVGFSNNDIVDYVTSLKDSQLFDNVVLGGTTSAAAGTTSVYNFTISLQIKA